MPNQTTNILYLSYDGLTDPLGQSQILPYVEGLSASGFAFTLISFEKPERFEKLKRKIQKRCDAANIEWHPLQYTKNPPVFSTIYDIRKMTDLASSLHKTHKFKLIHCRSYITSLSALKLKKRHKLPFIFDMRGFWADERVDGKIWDLKSPIYKTIYKYFKIRERTFLEKADAVVSLTHTGKKELENWFNENPLFGGSENYYNYDRVLSIQNKTTVIPCTTDTQLFDFQQITPAKKNWLGAVHGIDTSLEYLGYVGSLGTWYMGDEMIELYAHLLKSRPQLRFLFLSHDNLSKLRKKAEELGIPQSYIIQVSAQRREVPALMSLMTASVFFILPAYSKKASSPTKQGELMAMGIPIICNNNVGDTAEIISKYHAGHVVSGFNSNEFKAVAQRWETICNIPSDQIRKGAIEYFSLNKGINDYKSIYETIISRTIN